MAQGKLPNIARHLVEEGSSLPAVTSFPSTTCPAYLPFLTGCLPGTCNVPGIRWFDKDRYEAGWSFDRYRSYVGLESFCMARDMWPHIPTIFELIPDSFSWSDFNYENVPIPACSTIPPEEIERLYHETCDMASSKTPIRFSWFMDRFARHPVGTMAEVIRHPSRIASTARRLRI